MENLFSANSTSAEYKISRKDFEQELGYILRDVARQYSIVEETTRKEANQSSEPGSVPQYLPVGVSLVLVSPANPIRFIFGSLASNISAGNTLILATAEAHDSVFTFLQPVLGQFLDREAILAVNGVELLPALLDKIDLISIFGENPSENPNDSADVG